jgi:DNA-binding response OmpR family regulator
MTDAARVLVVEDDRDIRELLVLVLETSGLAVTSAETGAEAIAEARRSDPDLITLDLTLPDADGTDVCRELRTFTDAYIMMITGRSEQADRLVGLELGADDYLVKPFSAQEFRARVAALLRRPRASQQPQQAQPALATEAAASSVVDAGGGLVVDPAAHAASLDGTALPMTPAEVDLLAALAGSPGRTWTRSELVWAVWQGEFIESDYLVDVHVGNVRRKLRQAGSTRQWIVTVGGTAYSFAAPAPVDP